jgi:hypothetical protein
MTREMMAWNPDDNLPDSPLLPHERQATRRVLRWYEIKTIRQASIKVWASWLVAVPTAMMTVWGLIQLVMHGSNGVTPP